MRHIDEHHENKPAPGRKRAALIAERAREQDQNKRRRGRPAKNKNIRARTPDPSAWLLFAPAHGMLCTAGALTVDGRGDDLRKAQNHGADDNGERRILVVFNFLTY